MKFRVTVKSPDGVYESIREAAEESVEPLGLDKEEAEYLCEKRQESLSEFAAKWVKYGEYITVEFDTEAGTATVVPN